MPNTSSVKFTKKIKDLLINQEKQLINNNLLNQIESGNFKDKEFKDFIKKNNLSKEEIVINGVRDDNNLSKETLFRMSNKSFSIIMNKENKISLISIKKIQNKTINITNKDYNKFYFETGVNIKNNIYSSYDIYLSNKYKLKINEQTLDRLKNFFK